MAWAGKPSSQQKTAASFKSRSQPKPLPPTENPHAVIPTAVLEQLSRERLATKEAYNLRLQQLLTLHEINKGG